jgi:two-component system sensor histidine kinase HydH
MKEQKLQQLMIVLLALVCVWLLSTSLDIYLAGSERRVSGLISGGLGILLVLLGGRFLFWLSEKKLEQDKKEQQEIQLALLRQMSAVMAHELRNPLASAKGNSQLLAEMLEQGTKTQSKAEQVVQELIRVENLTNDLLEFIRSGKVHPRECDPSQLAKGIIERAGEIPIQISSEQAPATWLLDSHSIERVLLNLLRNAAQAQENRSEPIEVAVKQIGDELYISVRDHGPGPNSSVDVFAPFVTTKISGTGLGLSLSRQIVLAHNGRISLRAHPEGGAIAELYIPSGQA